MLRNCSHTQCSACLRTKRKNPPFCNVWFEFPFKQDGGNEDIYTTRYETASLMGARNKSIVSKAVFYGHKIALQQISQMEEETEKPKC